MVTAEHHAILRLHLLPEIGPMRFKRLVDRFGSASAVFAVETDELAQVEDIPLHLAHAIVRAPREIDVEEEIAQAERIGARIVTCIDEAYPEGLKNIVDSPPVVYLSGDITEADTLGIALVGTRHPTPYGRMAAERFGREFGEHGITTVSGLARGIDTVVHSSTLDAGGRTIAVLGTGLAVHYPPENRKLEERIRSSGCVVSEFPIQYPADRGNFPRRNRIISALSLATVVVEADIKSGALITARYCAEQGKDVFAVPGPIFSKYSRGPHFLLRSGARLAESAVDVLEEIRELADWFSRRKSATIARIDPSANMKPEEEEIVALLDAHIEGLSIDILSRDLHISPGDLASRLLCLEMKGLIRSLPGNMYIKVSV
jgi:DNA processing protein